MKLIFVLIGLIVFFKSTNGQSSDKIKIEKQYNPAFDSIVTIWLPAQNRLKNTETYNGESELVGNSVSTNIDFLKTATIISQTDLKTTYLLYVKSENACGLDFRFIDFTLPEGAEFYISNLNSDTIYNQYKGKYILGDRKYLDSKTVTDNKIYLRLILNKGTEKDCKITIEHIGLFFKAWWKKSTSRLKSTDPCIFNVSCCPNYTKWINEINSIIRISFVYTDAQGNKWVIRATGVFVNISGNYTLSSQPYVLTAAHLTKYDKDYANWAYTLNAQKSDCNVDFNPIIMPTGFKLAYCPPWSGDTNYENDYLLLQTIETVGTLQSYNVSYAGWQTNIKDYSLSLPNIFFHQPSYSDYDKQYAIANYNPIPKANGNLNLTIQTGYTEKGSSGSGVFNNDHKLIGINVAGVGTCTDPRQQWNEIVPIANILSIKAITDYIGTDTVAYTFNPNYTNLPVNCSNCIKDKNKGETGIDCGGPCKPCCQPNNNAVVVNSNIHQPIIKSMKGVTINGGDNSLFVNESETFEVYAQEPIIIKGNFHAKSNSQLKIKTQQFFDTEKRDASCLPLCSPYICNVFSPDNDGTYDKFTIVVANATYYKITFWDSKGKTLYSKEESVYTNDPIIVWDGAGLPNGSGVVYYHIEIYDCPYGKAYENTDFVYYFKSQTKSMFLVDKNSTVENNLIIYPNPSKDIITVSIPSSFSLPCKLEIYDMKGVLVKNALSENNLLNLNISDLSKGIYIIKVSDSSHISDQKIIIQ